MPVPCLKVSQPRRRARRSVIMAHWFEGIFSFLFKYRPTEFAKGSFAFGAPFSVIVLLLLSAAVPQRNYVGVLIDDSRSMQITDGKDKSRSDWVRHAFGGPDSSLLKALREKFVVRLFRFSNGAQRVDSVAELGFNAGETHLGDAVEQARQELDAVPLSGLVVLSDGADNSRAPIGDELLSLRARSVPIFTVGLGAEHFDKDIEIRRVEAAHSVLRGGALVADLMIRQRGYAGKRVPLVVEDNGQIVSRDSITLPPDGDVAPIRVS